MAFTTTLTKRLGLRHPIIQAPLAGGGDTPELIAAVSEAGAFGFIGAAYLTPPQILEAARAVKARTERPFGVSLFAPLRAPEVPKHPELALTRLAPYYAELGLTPPEIPALKPDAFPAQFAAVLESAASEQGARMTAMRNASKSAGELIDTLTLAMNRARQAEITQEILEVVAGADALTSS